MSKQVTLYLLDHGSAETELWDKSIIWLNETPESEILEPRSVQLRMSEFNAFTNFFNRT